MTAAAEAYRIAERLVEEARASGAESLSFAREDCRALDRLPDGIAGLTGLTGLSLIGTQVGDLSPLAGLTGLTGLSLDRTKVDDLSPVAGLSGLKRLSLSGTQVSDFSPLAGLAGLTGLSSNRTQVSDLSALAGLTGLTMLMLSDTQVSDLSPLAGLTGLTELWLSHTQVSDLSFLADLTEIRELLLYGIPATDLRPLRKLTRLVTEPGVGGLTFNDTGAARIDPRIAEIAEIENNAERARALFEFLKGWELPKLPEVPPQRPAPIIAVFDEQDRLVEASVESSPADVDAARAGWEALHEVYSDVAQSLSRPNLPNLTRAIAAFGRALGATFENMRPIALGTHGQRIIAISRTGAVALLDDAEGELIAFAAAIELHLQRFPDWVAYLRDTAREPEARPIQDALPALRAISESFQETEAISPQVAQKFDDLVKAAEDADLSPALARAGVLASLSNILSLFAARVLSVGRKVMNDLSNKTYEKGIEVVAGTIVTAGASAFGVALDIIVNKAQVLLWLAREYPRYLGWIDSVLRWLGYA